MKLLKHLLAFTLIASFLMALPAMAADGQDNSEHSEELNEKDFAALREFLRSKRLDDIEATRSNLVISGDLRTEWRNMKETSCGKALRGKHGVDLKGIPLSHNDFDIECNLYFNCVYERSWAVAHVRYDNSAGVDDNDHPCLPRNQKDVTKACDTCPVEKARKCLGDPEGYHGSGRSNSLNLKKAYFGYNFYSDDCTRVDVELGRRGNLYNILESNIQFLSRLDGLVFKYDSSCECVADWYVHAIGFVVDERVNHFAWATEVGFLNIADSNIDFKYSIIDWKKNGKNRCFTHDPAAFRSVNSQFFLEYHLDPSILSQPFSVYGAFLVNHAADKLLIGDTNRRTLQNLGWYAGIQIGKVRKEGDWAVEIQYQYVQAQSMPDDDSAGICRGNVLNESFTTCSQSGNTNFQGWQIDALYGFTDNISVNTILEASRAIDKRLGGAHTYSKIEIEAIYAF